VDPNPPPTTPYPHSAAIGGAAGQTAVDKLVASFLLMALLKF